MDWVPILRTFLGTVGYTTFGIVIFAIAFWLMVKVSPFSIRKELEADHNTALAVLMGAVIIGLSIIIAAAIHG